MCIFIATGCRKNFQISKMMQTFIFHLLLVLSTCRQLISAEIIEDDDRECTVSDTGIIITAVYNKIQSRYNNNVVWKWFMLILSQLVYIRI